MTTCTASLEIVPSGKALGADVNGIDLREGISDEVFEKILEAWYQHLVLRFRGQTINDREVVEFALRFGQLHHAAGAEYGGKPEDLHEAVELISNVVRDGRPIGALGAGEATWHTDMSMYEVPASATLLFGDTIPPSGGNTMFTNLYKAYDTLPERLRSLVGDRRSIHDAAYLATGGVRPGYEAVTDKSQGPGARHPIVRTHPYTNRKALYLGRKGFGYGMIRRAKILPRICSPFSTKRVSKANVSVSNATLSVWRPEITTLSDSGSPDGASLLTGR